MQIEFTVDPKFHGVIAEPVPAKAMIPDWFKSMPPYHPEFGPSEPGTVKSCPPFVDAMMSGYVIPFPATIYVQANTIEEVHFKWGPNDETPWVANHDDRQVMGSPFKGRLMKFIQPWIIRTPPGYSCLITAPFNQPNDNYTIIQAIVDTDVYQASINFPFVWHATGEHTLNDGDPMVHVFPFKREQWRLVVRASSANEVAEQGKEALRIKARRHFYRRFRRHKKSYS